MNKGSTMYHVEAKFTGFKWVTISAYRTLYAAYGYIHDHPPINYPMRVVRVTRTIMLKENL